MQEYCKTNDRSKSCHRNRRKFRYWKGNCSCSCKTRVKVTVAALLDKEGEETVRLAKEAGSEGIFVKTDVTNKDDIKMLVEKTFKNYNRLDYAFNNAVLCPKQLHH